MPSPRILALPLACGLLALAACASDDLGGASTSPAAATASGRPVSGDNPTTNLGAADGSGTLANGDKSTSGDNDRPGAAGR